MYVGGIRGKNKGAYMCSVRSEMRRDILVPVGMKYVIETEIVGGMQTDGKDEQGKEESLQHNVGG